MHRGFNVAIATVLAIGGCSVTPGPHPDPSVPATVTSTLPAEAIRFRVVEDPTVDALPHWSGQEAKVAIYVNQTLAYFRNESRQAGLDPRPIATATIPKGHVVNCGPNSNYRDLGNEPLDPKRQVGDPASVQLAQCVDDKQLLIGPVTFAQLLRPETAYAEVLHFYSLGAWSGLGRDGVRRSCYVGVLLRRLVAQGQMPETEAVSWVNGYSKDYERVPAQQGYNTGACA